MRTATSEDTAEQPLRGRKASGPRAPGGVGTVPKQFRSPSSGAKSRNLRIQYASLASLKPDPANPRRHGKKQVDQIARSIQTFGFNVPILVDRSRCVIAGHGRLAAAKLLKLDRVPIIRIEHLSDVQMRAFMIADNRLTENSIWDDSLLAEQLKALAVLELDFSIDVTGFEMGQIDMMIEGLATASRGKDDPADAIPDCGTKAHVSRAGDLWVLGRHRVHCGDARNDSTYSPLMQGRRAQMVFTDLPRNDSVDGCVTGSGKIHRPEFAVVWGGTSESRFTSLLTNVLAHLARNSMDGALHFICADWRYAGELIEAASSIHAEFKDLCVWVKDHAERNPLYRNQHELIFVFGNGKALHGEDIPPGLHCRHRSNVWRYQSVDSASRAEDGNLSALRPTIKPVALVADAILDCTGSGDVVLDPFLGSGTTLIAAERTGRVCHGIELDPRSVDTIVRRWQAFTGQSAARESTGQTFSEIEEKNNGRAQ